MRGLVWLHLGEMHPLPAAGMPVLVPLLAAALLFGFSVISAAAEGVE